MKVSLRAARVNAGYLQSDVAEKLNIGLRTVQNWESGKTSPRADQMPAICALYNCTADDIIFLPNDCG